MPDTRGSILGSIPINHVTKVNIYYTVFFFGFPQFLLHIPIQTRKRQSSQPKPTTSVVAFISGYITKLGEFKETH